MNLKKKSLKSLSNSNLKSVYGGITTTGAEPPQAHKQKNIKATFLNPID